ncbi:hypothetical protein [Moraxella lacunata]
MLIILVQQMPSIYLALICRWRWVYDRGFLGCVIATKCKVMGGLVHALP